MQDIGDPPQGVGPVDGVNDEGPHTGVLRAFDVEHGLDSHKFGGYPFYGEVRGLQHELVAGWGA